MDLLLERNSRPLQEYLEEKQEQQEYERRPHNVFLQSKREEREKERTLQKKIVEFQTQIQRLERRISLLRTENESLRRQKDDQKPLEEKIRALKKRNAELAAIARRLEEKAKSLQQENIKKSKEDGGQETDHLKRLFARQRARDLAEHAKNMLVKDREIEDLRKKCQELANQLSNGEFYAPENVQVYEEKEELVSIIKQAAKERLQLERQVTKCKPGEVVQQIDPEHTRQLKELEEANNELKEEVKKLDRALQLTDNLKTDLRAKEEECEVLHKTIQQQRLHTEELEGQLRQSEARNTNQSLELSELHSRLLQIEKVNEECSTLRVSLAEAQHEREIARNEVSNLHYKVSSLENLVKDLQQSTAKLQQLEYDYQVALQKNEQKQEEINRLHQSQDEARLQHEKAVTELKIRIQDLERQCHQHKLQQQQLTAELGRLHSDDRVLKPTVTVSAEIQTESPSYRTTGTDAPHLPFSPPNFLSSYTNQNDQRPDLQEFYHSSNFKLTNSEPNNNQIVPSDSNKSLDTGFAEEENEEELDSYNKASPDHKSDCGDPELNEIAKKLKELAVPDSDDEMSSLVEGREDSGMENSRETKNQNEISLSDSRLSSLSRKGPLQVYIAKYSYNPYQHSPNDNPAAELPLSAGDYVLILGDMDEDGFYEGELIHGKRGLVPSNFIEKVSDEHLSEFHAAMALACHQSDESTVNSIQHDLEFNSSDEADFTDDIFKACTDTHCDLEDIEEVMDGDKMVVAADSRLPYNPGTIGVPFPTCLSLDRQLSNSILVSWKPPEVTTDVNIQSYHVLVDGEFMTSVRGHERTKALLEGIDSKLTHRVCVRCLSNQGQSKDGQCTLLIGKDILPIPSDIVVSDITANSAVISWMPGNSNYSHCIEVNGQDVHLLRPGICKYTVSGLAPACTHNVKVYVREAPEYKQSLHLLTASTEFTTLLGGSPDPPLNVQVEAGPQEGTLLLTWLPMTINPSGVSNGAVVAGYVVYADGRRTREARGPTNDHIILGPEDLKGHIPKQLTVRTLAVDGKESAESSIVRLPPQLIRELTATVSKSSNTSPKMQPKYAFRHRFWKSSKSPTGIIEHAGNNIDAEIDAAFEGVHGAADDAPVSPVENSQYADPFIESSSSELSDIPEVEEELIGSEEANQGTGYTGQSTNQQEKQLSPQPAPRTIRPSPSPTTLQPQRNIPAIEITRDSSSERGTSFEDDTDSVKLTKQTSPIDAHNTVPSVSRRTAHGAASSHRNTSSPLRTAPEVPKRHSPGSPKSPKYGADSDGRDGFREKNAGMQNDTRNDKYGVSRHPTSPTKSPQEAGFHGNKMRESSPGLRPSEHVSLNDSEDYDDNCDVDSISGEINPPMDDSKRRLFVALFDYEPSVMSPNTDALDEELPFREGQILTIYGEKDADGFYRGEYNGRSGYVPCNMVSEIHIDDPSLIDELLKESTGQTMSPMSSDKTYSVKAEINHHPPPQEHLTPNGISSVPQENSVRRMLALYDYDPQELSPNVDAELEITFKAGDMITVYGEMDEDGFYRGECRGIRGYVPSNFLQEMSSTMSDDEVLDSASMVSPSRSGESISAVSRHSDGFNNIGVESASPPADAITLEPVIPLTPPSSLAQTATQEETKKKKGGILNRGKNIFKKLAR
ncbi:RIMS-binding protein 2-like isoform X4 [Gigantopelta aegis]|uniref:RIMS-binding protein 2-like isoform X4 n=1 Tax=Gigantopelta aegis TaxID=1735272 RepID=UPI001B88D8B5|nr:RIMS-binding protein 2-like isoform X4 [Gigantopelta aegis]